MRINLQCWKGRIWADAAQWISPVQDSKSIKKLCSQLHPEHQWWDFCCVCHSKTFKRSPMMCLLFSWRGFSFLLPFHGRYRYMAWDDTGLAIWEVRSNSFRLLLCQNTATDVHIKIVNIDELISSFCEEPHLWGKFGLAPQSCLSSDLLYNLTTIFKYTICIFTRMIMMDYASFIYFLYWIWRSHFRCIAFIFLHSGNLTETSIPTLMDPCGLEGILFLCFLGLSTTDAFQDLAPEHGWWNRGFQKWIPQVIPQKDGFAGLVLFQNVSTKRKCAKNAANIRLKDGQSMKAMWGHYSSCFCCSDVILGAWFLTQPRERAWGWESVTILTILKFTQTMGRSMFGPPAVWAISRKCFLLLEEDFQLIDGNLHC